MSDDPRWPVAIHEAGHAVVSRFLRRSVRGISIREDEDSYGHVLYRPRPAWFQPDLAVDTRHRQILEQEVMIAYGGIEAQRFVDGDEERLLIGAAVDLDAVAELVLYMSGGERSEAEAYGLWLTRRTKNLVSRQLAWAAITGLATRLLVDEQMTGKRCRAAIQEAIEAHVAKPRPSFARQFGEPPAAGVTIP